MKNFLLLLVLVLAVAACSNKESSDKLSVSKNGYVQCKIAGTSSYRYPADGVSKFAIHLDTTASPPAIQVESDSPGKMTMVHRLQSGETCAFGPN